MPRYYKDKIYTPDERGQIKAKWSAEMQQKMDEQYYLSPQEKDQIAQAQAYAFEQMHKQNLKLKQKI